MRIAITGVSSTGKTTLSKELAKKLEMSWISEGCNGAFEYLEHTGQPVTTKNFTEMTARDHFEFEKALAAARAIRERAVGTFVADGEPLLWLSYMMLKCSLSIPVSELNQFHKAMFKMVDAYDYIWYVPFGQFPIVSDGYRIDNPFFLRAQDAVLRDLISEYTAPFNHKCKILDIKAGHHDYRLDEITRVLDNART